MALSLPRPPRMPLDANNSQSVDVWNRWFEDVRSTINAIMGGELRIPGPGGKFYKLTVAAGPVLQIEEVA